MNTSTESLTTLPADLPGPKVRGRARRFANITRRRSAEVYDPGYSRFVSMSKLLLPVVAALLIGLIVVWPHVKAVEKQFRMGFASLDVDASEDPSLVNPRYTGANSEGRFFSITADLARTPPADKEVIDLEQPKADLTLEDGTWVVLTAESGIFYRDANTLDLIGNVNVFHDSGYEFSTASAQIDLKTGTASGAEPVEGQGPFGDLQAEGFRMTGKGNTIYFTGKATLFLHPGIGAGFK